MTYKAPEGYKSQVTLRETQAAIKFIKDTFQVKLANALNLSRVTAPIIVKTGSGINDDLNGVERKVEFTLLGDTEHVEIVQSLAKWKRMALHRYEFNVGEGLYTDMNAIRRDDSMDNTHSIFVDQWDWERIISKEERNLDFLKSIVDKIVEAIVDTRDALVWKYPHITADLSRDVYFITSQELEDLYPGLSAKERETEIVKKYKTVFIMQIGGVLKSGEKHDGRAPDYDDWSLNGDIMFWDETLQIPLEVSSMGIRVDAEALDRQLKICGNEERREYAYHKGILDGTLPLTIGGGIGQSRLCMLMLEKAHIGEVQVSYWTDEERERCKKEGIVLL